MFVHSIPIAISEVDGESDEEAAANRHARQFQTTLVGNVQVVVKDPNFVSVIDDEHPLTLPPTLVADGLGVLQHQTLSLEPSMVLRTEYSTFTYFLTSVESGSTVIRTDLVISTKVITETPSIRPTSTLKLPSESVLSSQFEVQATRTLLLTSTLFSTLVESGTTVTTTFTEIRPTVITETASVGGVIDPSEVLKPSKTLLTSDTALQTDGVKYISLGSHLFGQINTLFATYTYFTTLANGQVEQSQEVLTHVSTSLFSTTRLPDSITVENNKMEMSSSSSLQLMPSQLAEIKDSFLSSKREQSSASSISAASLSSSSFSSSSSYSSSSGPGLLFDTAHLSSLKSSFASSSSIRPTRTQTTSSISSTSTTLGMLDAISSGLDSLPEVDIGPVLDAMATLLRGPIRSAIANRRVESSPTSTRSPPPSLTIEQSPKNNFIPIGNRGPPPISGYSFIPLQQRSESHIGHQHRRAAPRIDLGEDVLKDVEKVNNDLVVNVPKDVYEALKSSDGHHRPIVLDDDRLIINDHLVKSSDPAIIDILNRFEQSHLFGKNEGKPMAIKIVSGTPMNYPKVNIQSNLDPNNALILPDFNPVHQSQSGKTPASPKAPYRGSSSRKPPSKTHQLPPRPPRRRPPLPARRRRPAPPRPRPSVPQSINEPEDSTLQYSVNNEVVVRPPEGIAQSVGPGRPRPPRRPSYPLPPVRATDQTPSLDQTTRRVSGPVPGLPTRRPSAPLRRPQRGPKRPLGRQPNLRRPGNPQLRRPLGRPSLSPSSSRAPRPPITSGNRTPLRPSLPSQAPPRPFLGTPAGGLTPSGSPPRPIASGLPPPRPQPSGSPPRSQPSGSPPRSQPSGSPPRPQPSGSPPRPQPSGSPPRPQPSGSPPRPQPSGSPPRSQISGSPSRPPSPSSPPSGVPLRPLASGSPLRSPASDSPLRLQPSGKPPRTPSSGVPPRLPSPDSPPRSQPSGTLPRPQPSGSPPRPPSSGTAPRPQPSGTPPRPPAPGTPPRPAPSAASPIGLSGVATVGSLLSEPPSPVIGSSIELDSSTFPFPISSSNSLDYQGWFTEGDSIPVIKATGSVSFSYPQEEREVAKTITYANEWNTLGFDNSRSIEFVPQIRPSLNTNFEREWTVRNTLIDPIVTQGFSNTWGSFVVTTVKSDTPTISPTATNVGHQIDQTALGAGPRPSNKSNKTPQRPLNYDPRPRPNRPSPTRRPSTTRTRRPPTATTRRPSATRTRRPSTTARRPPTPPPRAATRPSRRTARPSSTTRATRTTGPTTPRRTPSPPTTVRAPSGAITEYRNPVEDAVLPTVEATPIDTPIHGPDFHSDVDIVHRGSQGVGAGLKPLSRPERRPEIGPFNRPTNNEAIVGPHGSFEIGGFRAPQSTPYTPFTRPSTRGTTVDIPQASGPQSLAQDILIDNERLEDPHSQYDQDTYTTSFGFNGPLRPTGEPHWSTEFGLSGPKSSELPPRISSSQRPSSQSPFSTATVIEDSDSQEAGSVETFGGQRTRPTSWPQRVTNGHRQSSLRPESQSNNFNDFEPDGQPDDVIRTSSNEGSTEVSHEFEKIITTDSNEDLEISSPRPSRPTTWPKVTNAHGRPTSIPTNDDTTRDSEPQSTNNRDQNRPLSDLQPIKTRGQSGWIDWPQSINQSPFITEERIHSTLSPNLSEEAAEAFSTSNESSDLLNESQEEGQEDNYETETNEFDDNYASNRPNRVPLRRPSLGLSSLTVKKGESGTKDLGHSGNKDSNNDHSREQIGLEVKDDAHRDGNQPKLLTANDLGSAVKVGEEKEEEDDKAFSEASTTRSRPRPRPTLATSTRSGPSSSPSSRGRRPFRRPNWQSTSASEHDDHEEDLEDQTKSVGENDDYNVDKLNEDEVVSVTEDLFPGHVIDTSHLLEPHARPSQTPRPPFRPSVSISDLDSVQRPRRRLEGLGKDDERIRLRPQFNNVGSLEKKKQSLDKEVVSTEKDLDKLFIETSLTSGQTSSSKTYESSKERQDTSTYFTPRLDSTTTTTTTTTSTSTTSTTTSATSTRRRTTTTRRTTTSTRTTITTTTTTTTTTSSTTSASPTTTSTTTSTTRPQRRIPPSSPPLVQLGGLGSVSGLSVEDDVQGDDRGPVHESDPAQRKDLFDSSLNIVLDDVPGQALSAADADTRCQSTCNIYEVCTIHADQIECQCRPGFGRATATAPCTKSRSYQLEVLARSESERIAVVSLSPKAVHRVVQKTLKDTMAVKTYYEDRFHGSELSSIKVGNATKRKAFFGGQRSLAPNEHMAINLVLHVLDDDEQSSSTSSSSSSSSSSSTSSLRSSSSWEEALLSLLESPMRKTRLPLGDENVKVFDVRMNDLDECEDADRHDCSEHAVCRNVRGSYECSCQEGFHDLSPSEQFKGRVCSATSSECSLCSQNGRCVIRGSELSCACRPWYAGRHCQINLRLLLIVGCVSVALMIFIACAVACFCCRDQESHLLPSPYGTSTTTLSRMPASVRSQHMMMKSGGSVKSGNGSHLLLPKMGGGVGSGGGSASPTDSSLHLLPRPGLKRHPSSSQTPRSGNWQDSLNRAETSHNPNGLAIPRARVVSSARSHHSDNDEAFGPDETNLAMSERTSLSSRHRRPPSAERMRPTLGHGSIDPLIESLSDDSVPDATAVMEVDASSVARSFNETIVRADTRVLAASTSALSYRTSSEDGRHMAERDNGSSCIVSPRAQLYRLHDSDGSLESL